MSRAAKRRRWLRWRAYRYRCQKLTGQRPLLTRAGGDAWFGAIYRTRGGRFFTLPPWRHVKDETDYLLRNRANAARLRESIAQVEGK